MSLPLRRMMTGARLRAAPNFDRVSPDRLPRVAQVLLGPATAGRGDLIAFLPREPGWRRAHLVSKEAWDLIISLERPSTPELEALDFDTVARLVLDGLLEIEWQGDFRSGPEAHPIFFGRSTRPEPIDRLGRLSRAAIDYAAQLGISDPIQLAHRMYRFNAKPRSPAWRRRLPDDRAVGRFLELDKRATRSTRTERAMESYQHEVWQAWDAPSPSTATPGAPTYKLYVSPVPLGTAKACRALQVTLGTRRGPFSMKVGRDLDTLLRPDRLVAYFRRLDDLIETTKRLKKTLKGMPVQGVPFTSALDDSGLFSWGADAADNPDLPSSPAERSWRAWITARLGAALATAISAQAPVSPQQYALDRIALDGVNPDTWEPPAAHADY